MEDFYTALLQFAKGKELGSKPFDEVISLFEQDIKEMVESWEADRVVDDMKANPEAYGIW